MTDPQPAQAHTPGPWKIIEQKGALNNAYWIGPEKYMSVCEVRNGADDEEYGGKEAELANARLIAAAPETAAERDTLRDQVAFTANLIPQILPLCTQKLGGGQLERELNIILEYTKRVLSFSPEKYISGIAKQKDFLEKQLSETVDAYLKVIAERDRLKAELAQCKALKHGLAHDSASFMCELQATNAKLLGALKAGRSALDKLMGDSDIEGDDSEEFLACQKISAAIAEAEGRS